MKFEFSAGGIVIKKKNDITCVLLAQHGVHHGWVFPKGIIGDVHKDEKKEETAVREVEEETGVLTTLGQPLTPVTYWYQMDGEKREKTVYYFLMEFVSEDASKKDDEMESVKWIPMEEVEKKLTYPSDREVWREAKQLVVGSE